MALTERVTLCVGDRVFCSEAGTVSRGDGLLVIVNDFVTEDVTVIVFVKGREVALTERVTLSDDDRVFCKEAGTVSRGEGVTVLDNDFVIVDVTDIVFVKARDVALTERVTLCVGD